MIEIKCAAPDQAAELCTRVGEAAQVVLIMTEREVCLGFACMSYDGEEAVLSYLEAPDTALTDALLRAALNAARSAGMKTAQILSRPLCLHMEQKGYFSDSGSGRVEIANFFAKSVCKA